MWQMIILLLFIIITISDFYAIGMIPEHMPITVKIMNKETNSCLREFSSTEDIWNKFSALKSCKQDVSDENYYIPIDEDQYSGLHIPERAFRCVEGKNDPVLKKLCEKEEIEKIIHFAEAYAVENSDEVKNSIAALAVKRLKDDISFENPDQLCTQFHLNKDAGKDWFLKFLPLLPDQKKEKIRRNYLYEYMYTNKEFSALQQSVVAMHQNNYLSDFTQLPALQLWEKSYAHQCYLAARPSTVRSCQHYMLNKDSENNEDKTIDLIDCYHLETLTVENLLDTEKYIKKQRNEIFKDLPYLHLPILSLIILCKDIRRKNYFSFSLLPTSLMPADVTALLSFQNQEDTDRIVFDFILNADRKTISDAISKFRLLLLKVPVRSCKGLTYSMVRFRPYQKLDFTEYKSEMIYEDEKIKIPPIVRSILRLTPLFITVGFMWGFYCYMSRRSDEAMNRYYSDLHTKTEVVSNSIKNALVYMKKDNTELFSRYGFSIFDDIKSSELDRFDGNINNVTTHDLHNARKALDDLGQWGNACGQHIITSFIGTIVGEVLIAMGSFIPWIHFYLDTPSFMKSGFIKYLLQIFGMAKRDCISEIQSPKYH